MRPRHPRASSSSATVINTNHSVAKEIAPPKVRIASLSLSVILFADAGHLSIELGSALPADGDDDDGTDTYDSAASASSSDVERVRSDLSLRALATSPTFGLLKELGVDQSLGPASRQRALVDLLDQADAALAGTQRAPRRKRAMSRSAKSRAEDLRRMTADQHEQLWLGIRAWLRGEPAQDIAGERADEIAQSGEVIDSLTDYVCGEAESDRAAQQLALLLSAYEALADHFSSFSAMKAAVRALEDDDVVARIDFLYAWLSWHARARWELQILVTLMCGPPKK